MLLYQNFPFFLKDNSKQRKMILNSTKSKKFVLNEMSVPKESIKKNEFIFWFFG